MQKKLVVYAGPSGSGKTSTVKKVLGICPSMKRVVTTTTRAMRPGEIEGKSYFFVTKDEFERRWAAGGILLERDTYADNFYGAGRNGIEQVWSEGYRAILDVTLPGVIKVKEAFPDCLVIFLAPRSFSELEKRIVARDEGATSLEALKARLETAKIEIETAYQHCDAILTAPTNGVDILVRRSLSLVEDYLR